METDEKDPSVIPEEIKEYVRAAHKAQRESRPDESWRIQRAQKQDAVAAPYKQDEDSEETGVQPMMGDDDLKMARGGVVPGYSDGGDVSIMDTNDDLQSMQDQAAARESALLSNVSQPIRPDVAEVPPPNAGSDGQGPGAVLRGSVPPAGQDPTTALRGLLQSKGANAPSGLPPTTSSDMAMPASPSGTSPQAPSSLTDADYAAKAAKMIGTDPGQQSDIMKALGAAQQRGSVGTAIAGLGDAIAQGGTLGKVNPGGAQRSQDLIASRTAQGLEGAKTLQGNKEKTTDLALKLESQDPNSPLSKYAQKAYGDVGKKLGINLSKAPASLIADITGKGVSELNDEAELAVRKEGLDIQKGQLSQTIENNKAQREHDNAVLAETTKERQATEQLAREGKQTEAATKLGTRTAGNKLEGLFPGTSANLEKKALEREATGGDTETGPFGAETMRNGKTYEWSPETGKYHLKQ